MQTDLDVVNAIDDVNAINDADVNAINDAFFDSDFDANNDAERGNPQTLHYPTDGSPENPAPTPRTENPQPIQKIIHGVSKINF